MAEQITLEQLRDAFLHRESRKIGRIYEQLRQGVLPLLRRRFGDSPEVEDAFQESFTRIVEGILSGEQIEIGNLSAFLFVSAQRRFLDRYRRVRRFEELAEKVAPMEKSRLSNPMGTPRISSAFAYAFLTGLGPVCLRILRSNTGEQGGLERLSEELGVGVATIYRQRQKCFEAIRKLPFESYAEVGRMLELLPPNEDLLRLFGELFPNKKGFELFLEAGLEDGEIMKLIGQVSPEGEKWLERIVDEVGALYAD